MTYVTAKGDVFLLGKKAAAEDPELILHLMCDLMEHEDAYVVSPLALLLDRLF